MELLKWCQETAVSQSVHLALAPPSTPGRSAKWYERDQTRELTRPSMQSAYLSRMNVVLCT